MDKNDLLEAMSGIRDQYIEEAGQKELFSDQTASEEMISGRKTAGINNTAGASPETDSSREAAFTEVRDSFDSGKEKKEKRSRSRFRALRKWATTIAALLCLSVLLPNLSPGFSRAFRGIPVFEQYFNLVTIRKNASESSTAMAGEEDEGTVNVMSDKNDEESAPASQESEQTLAAGDQDSGTACAEGAYEEAASADEFAYAEEAEDTFDETAEEDMEEEPYDGSLADIELDEELYGEAVPLDEALASAGIEDGLRETVTENISVYENSISSETGDDSLEFSHIIKTDSDEWFCVAVTARSAEKHGYTQTEHFVFNKETGEPVTLKSCFGEENDFTDALSAAIINQMREQMAADPYMQYWLEDSNHQEDTGSLAMAQKTETDEALDTDKAAEADQTSESNKTTDTDKTMTAGSAAETDRTAEADTTSETAEKGEKGKSSYGGKKEFTGISPDQDFYIDEDGNLVICFNENEVSPVYMGNVEFTIPEEITDSLEK